MKIVFIVYLTIIVISLIIGFEEWKKITKCILNNKGNEFDIKDCIPEHIIGGGLDELKKVKPIIISQFKYLFEILLTLLSLPIFIFRMAIISKFSLKIVWRLPIDLFDFWYVFLLLVSYYLSALGENFTSLTIAAIITIGFMVKISSKLDTDDDGNLTILKTPQHQLVIYDLVSEALITIIGFGSIYFSISKINPDAFNQKMNILDSIYYSFMVGTTVGFGEIHPKSSLTKLLSIIEAFSGFFFIIFVVAVFMNVWIEKKNL